MSLKSLPVPPRWLLLFACLAFAFAGSRSLWDPDEGRYAETARAMLAGGDWLVPRLQGHEHLTKPPFTYWTIATGLAVFGVNEWGARLPMAAAFFVTILAVVALARAWRWSDRESLAAGLVFATSILPFGCAHIVTTDMLLTCWMTLGLLCAWRVWHGASHPARWRWGFWIAFGMAFLTKGPPGWLPLLVMVVFCLLRRRAFAPAARLFSPLGLIAMLLLAGSWYIAMMLRRPDLVHFFLREEVVNRILTDEHGREKPLYFYVAVILFGVGPWLMLWPSFFTRLHARIRAGWRRLADVELFSFLWFVIPFLIFNFTKSKMFFYVVPLMVPLALWFGRLWVKYCGGDLWPRHGGRRLLANALAVLTVAAMLVFLNLPDTLPQSRGKRPLAEALLRVDPEGRMTIWSATDPSHTLSFYTGRPIREHTDGTSRKETYDHVAEETREGDPAVMEMELKRAIALKKDRPELVIFARTGRHALIASPELVRQFPAIAPQAE